MPVNDALKLIKAIDNDASLRREMVSCNSCNELKEYLFNKGYSFTNNEFEEAVKRCNTYDNGRNLIAKVEWYNYLIFSLS
ncbi:MAG: Nif11-like leader peptide family natural product precursor [Marinilabiliaceae bacterium]|nr:Nif11-like leader peptide family natural product precursor [Marinilabiliaceae bacterium]